MGELNELKMANQWQDDRHNFALTLDGNFPVVNCKKLPFTMKNSLEKKLHSTI